MNNKNNVVNDAKQRGFSLMELMIAVAILGIISSIAYPSYIQQVRKSKRTPAKVELMRVAQLQESFYVQHLSYAESLSTLGFSSDTIQTEGGDYNVTIASKTPSDCDGSSVKPCVSYTLTATPVLGKSQSHDDFCTGFRLTNTGAKSAKSSVYTTYGTASVRDACW